MELLGYAVVIVGRARSPDCAVVGFYVALGNLKLSYLMIGFKIAWQSFVTKQFQPIGFIADRDSNKFIVAFNSSLRITSSVLQNLLLVRLSIHALGWSY